MLGARDRGAFGCGGSFPSGCGARFGFYWLGLFPVFHLVGWLGFVLGWLLGVLFVNLIVCVCFFVICFVFGVGVFFLLSGSELVYWFCWRV